ncbi:hypothetical protein T265_12965, partial [Opisthorchis viverrini]
PPKKKETDKQKRGSESSGHDVKLVDATLPTDSPSNLTESIQDGVAEKVQNECQELIVKEYERRVQSLQNHLRTLMEENEEATAEMSLGMTVADIAELGTSTTGRLDKNFQVADDYPDSMEDVSDKSDQPNPKLTPLDELSSHPSSNELEFSSEKCPPRNILSNYVFLRALREAIGTHNYQMYGCAHCGLDWRSALPWDSATTRCSGLPHLHHPRLWKQRIRKPLRPLKINPLLRSYVNKLQGRSVRRNSTRIPLYLSQSAAEIHSLDVFLANRDAMIHQCQYLEKCLERMEMEHQKDLDELTRQNLEDRALLKKNAMKRLEEVASEFRNDAYDRLKPVFRELLQENISIDEGLVQLTGAIQSLTKENAELGVTHRNLQRERRQLGNEHIKLATHNSAVIKLTHLLVVHQNRLDSMSQEQISDCLSALDSLKGQCTELERQEARAAESLERTKDGCELKGKQIEMLRKLSEAHISWTADTAKALSKATELIQNFMCCSTPEETSIEETAKVIEGIVYHLRPSLIALPKEDNAAILDFSWEDDKLEESLSVSEADKNDVVSSDEDKSEASGISEPHGWQIDDTIEVSEPEPASDEELTPARSSTSAKPLDTKDNVGLQHRFMYLDQIGTNLPLLQLNDYCPSSKEWQELLNCFVKHLPGREKLADDVTPDKDENGCLLPGDLYLIPPPGATIPTAKEQTHMLKRYEVEKLFAPLAEQSVVR